MFFPNRVKIVTIYKNIFSNLDKLLQVFVKLKGAGAAIRNFGYGSGRQFHFGAPSLGSETLKTIVLVHLNRNWYFYYY
jgi:hypothetical protein